MSIEESTPGEHARYSLKEIARRAAIVFAAEGWTWYGNEHVPNAVEIEETIKERLTNKQYGDLPAGAGRLAVYEEELQGEDGVTVALELGGLSGEGIDAL